MQLRPSAETPTDIRRRNRFAILSLLRDHGPLTKADLARLTDRTNTTITTILESLQDEALVDEVEDNGHAENGRGRPASLYQLSSDRWLVVGIQIASNAVVAMLMRLDGEVVVSRALPAPAEMASDAVLDLAASLLENLLAEYARDAIRILGIGVALEGFVDVETGTSRWMLFRKEWIDVPVAAYFQKRFSLPVLTDYRVYAATLAEAVYGEGRGLEDFAYLNIDTGVAVGVVASGQLIRTHESPAGITGGLGHVLKTDSNTPCFCGNVGCLYNEITTHALLGKLRDLLTMGQSYGISTFWMQHEPTFDNLIEAARQNDGYALQLRHRFAHDMGIAVAGVVQLFSSSTVIVGGPTIHFGGDEAIEVAVRAAHRLRVLHPLFGSSRIIASRLTPDSATVGAATLVVQAVMEGPISAAQSVANENP